uniref:Transcription termination factor 2 n=1 Tax=Acrobeloides nanus TaxID=290746 RepID=A0A914C6P3_9BILA
MADDFLTSRFKNVFTSTPIGPRSVQKDTPEIENLSFILDGAEQGDSSSKSKSIKKALFNSSNSDLEEPQLELSNEVLAKDSFDKGTSDQEFQAKNFSDLSSISKSQSLIEVDDHNFEVSDLSISMQAMSVDARSFQDDENSQVKPMRQEYDRNKDRSRSILYSNSPVSDRDDRYKKKSLRRDIVKNFKGPFSNRVEIMSSDESMASLQSKERRRSIEDITNKKPARVIKVIEISDEEPEPSIEEISHSTKSFHDEVVIEESSDDDEVVNQAESSVVTIDSESDISQDLFTKKASKKINEDNESSVISPRKTSQLQSSNDDDSIAKTPSSHSSNSEDEAENRAQLIERFEKLSAKRNKAAKPEDDLKLALKISKIEHKLGTFSDNDDVQIIDQPKEKKKNRGPILVSPPRINPEIRPIQDGKRLFGGKMTEERFHKVETVTGDTIKTMHNEASNVPDENNLIETPKGINVDLMHHQKVGLAWLVWRETQQTRGGILADDMGLGKTLSMISLILHQKIERDEGRTQTTKSIRDHEGLIPSNCTLVVAPASLVYQWENEITKFVKCGHLGIETFHGSNREENARILAKNDVVLTTYGVVQSELTDKSINDSDDGKKHRKKWASNASSVLAQIAWDRIILDEAHKIKNRKTNISKACCQLNSRNRWCLTGTPIHNELWDLYSLVKVVPFCEEQVWQQYIMNSNRGNNDRLHTMVNLLLKRRTKDQISTITNKPIVELKAKKFDIVKVKMEGIELKCYMQMMAASKQQAKLLIDSENDYYMRRKRKDEPVRNPFLGGMRDVHMDDHFQAMSCLLVLLLRLRQAAVHMFLTKEALDLDAFRDEGLDTNEAVNFALEQLNATMEELNLGKDDEHKGEEKNEIDRLFSKKYKTAKIKAVLAHLDRVLDAGDKCVIVSQWTSVLDILEYHLKKRDADYTSITGNVLPKDRQQRVNSFNQTKGGARVMLLSLTAGGVGLNLVGGNHLFLIDLHWNPALELQAFDRIYRIGQSKDVFIHKFITEDTIEPRVLKVQDDKSELARNVLDGVKKANPKKLTMNDMRFLFITEDTIEPRVLKVQDDKSELARNVLDGVKKANPKKLTMNDMRFLFDIQTRPYGGPGPSSSKN